MSIPSKTGAAALRSGVLTLLLLLTAPIATAHAQDTAQGDPAQGTGPLPPNVALNRPGFVGGSNS